jgi:hypothetical protein
MLPYGTTVTFDSNALDKAARPDRHPKDAARADFHRVNDGLKAGRLKGFFSETLATLEGIENKDRMDVLGSTRLESRSSSPDKRMINITIALKQDRKPRHPEFSKRIQAALLMGMRAIRGPARLGVGFHVKDDDGTFYASDKSVHELVERREKANQVSSAIEARHVGRWIALSLGLEFSRRDGASGELWLQGLKRAKDAHEAGQVKRAVREWADADSIAAHIGDQIDLFCTGDWGRGANRAGAASVFDPINRAWLNETYGVRFVSLSELAAMLA